MQVPRFLEEYKGCLATRKFDEAEEINKEINNFIANEINTTGWELKRFADDLLTKADRIEKSIPVYFATASLFEKEGDLRGMSLCVFGDWFVEDEWVWRGQMQMKIVGIEGGMHGANLGMIKRDVTMKEVAKCHVIPLMRDIKNQMLEVTPTSEKEAGEYCKRMSYVLEYIAESEKLVYDDVAAKEAREESKVWLERWRGMGEGK